MLDKFILWSGWSVAVGMGIWKIVEALRNRPAMKFCIGMSEAENLLYLTVMNTGRRPIKLIKAGLQYADGTSFDFPPSWNVSLGLFHNSQPKINRLSLKHIKDFINEIEEDAPIMVRFIYFTDENVRRYKVKIPSQIRDVLYS